MFSHGAESEDEVDEDFDAPEPTEAEVVADAVTDEKEALEREKKPQMTKRYVDPERQKRTLAVVTCTCVQC
jgi:hypothetical protein